MRDARTWKESKERKKKKETIVHPMLFGFDVR
jgi:hypothetical protein